MQDAFAADDGGFLWCLTGANVLVMLLLIGAIFRIGSTWLRGTRESEFTGKVHAASQAVSSVATRTKHVSSYSFKSLMWLGLRLNWVPVSILCAAMLIFGWCSLESFRYSPILIGQQFLCAFIELEVQYDGMKATADFVAFAVSVWTLFTFCSFSGAFAGLVTFRGDQSGSSFLFFQHQADFPRRVWLSRMALLGVMLLIASISIWLMVGSVRTSRYFAGISNSPIYWQATKWNAVLVFLTAASMAQLVSIVCRSGVIAFFLTGGVIVVTIVWCRIALTTYTPLVMLVGPLIVMCFVATWWYAPRWIAQRKPIGSVATSIAMAVSVFVASTAGFVWHRISIPGSEVSAEYREAFDSHDRFLESRKERFGSVFELKEAMASIEIGVDGEAFETVSAIDRRNPAKWPAESLKNFVNEYRSELEKVQHAVSDDLIYHWTTPTSPTLRQSQYRTVAEVLALGSEHFRREKDVASLLDSLNAEVQAAWRLNPKPASKTTDAVMKFCKWSEMEGQTGEQLRSGLACLKRLRSEIFDPNSERVQHEVYFDIRCDFRTESPDRSFLMGVLEDGPRHWERIRERRLKMLEFTQFAQAVSERSRSPFEFWLAESTNNPGGSAGNSHVTEFLAIDQAIAYASVRIALQIWRLEHGSYPKSLEQLANNKVLPIDEMRFDRVYGLPFAYFPKGLDRIAFIPTSSSFSRFGDRAREYEAPEVFESSSGIEPNRPFLLPFAGNFESRPVLIVKSESTAFRYMRGYRFVVPISRGSDMRSFFSVNGEHYILPVKDPSKEDDASQDDDQEIER